MSSQFQEYVDRQIAEIYRRRESVCQQAWTLTHPLFRDRLIQIVQNNLDADDWAVGCRVDP
jgi:hypothetical protein